MTYLVEQVSGPPNPHDFWGQPDNAVLQATVMQLAAESSPTGRVASLEPVVRGFLNQADTLPSEDVVLSGWRRHERFGLGDVTDAIHCVLDAQVRAESGGRHFVASVQPDSFVDDGFKFQSKLLALGDIDDARDPSDYAPVAARVMMHDGYRASWRQRESDAVIAARRAEAAARAERRAQETSVAERAVLLERGIGQRVLAIVLEAAAAQLGSEHRFSWSGDPGTVVEKTVRDELRTADVSGRVPATLAVVGERAAQGIVPALPSLLTALAALKPEMTPAELLARLSPPDQA